MRALLLLSSVIALAGCEVTMDRGSNTTEMAAAQTAPAASAEELAQMLRDGSITSQQIVRTYLARIEAYDRQGPELQSMIALNPNAMAEAAALDAEAAAGNWRGPLHGIPVVVKDNVETKELPTTAGSLALKNNMTGRDAPIIARLRAEGAIILGKTNLSEWANFRSFDSMSGWSGIGGQARNPHSLDRSPCGSSSGSGVAVAAMLAPLAIGTETNGSILCPASMNGIVGFKPTVGLLPRTHIVPISSSQDTAGPMTRSVHDAAVMLSVMAGSDQQDPASDAADKVKMDFTEALETNLNGMRIGVLRSAVGSFSPVEQTFNAALGDLKAQGAELVEIEWDGTSETFWDDALFVLETEFKHTLNEYLSEAAPAVETRTLADLIAYNASSERELALFDDSIFVASEETEGLDDPKYLAALENIQTTTRQNGIDKMLKDHNVQVLVAPSRPPAFLIDAVYGDQYPSTGTGAGWMAAIAGYPNMSVPMGSYRGLPLGLDIMGAKWDDATILKVGYAYEQASQKIETPDFAHGPFGVDETEDAMRAYTGSAE